MTIDNELRDSLRERVGDITGAPDAFEAIEHGVMRARRRRTALATVAAIVVLAGGGVMASSLLSSDDPRGFVAPWTDPAPTPAPSAVESSQVGGNDTEQLPWQHAAQYFDRRGYYVAYPEDFVRVEWEGNVEIRLPDTPSLASGQPTFAVNFDIHRGTTRIEACGATADTVTIRGESVETCESRGTEYTRTHVFYWDNHPCDHPELGCRSRNEGVTVIARIIAGNKELWDQHLETGEQIVGTVKRSKPEPAGTRELDDARTVVVKFLDARVGGRDAESFMAKSAEPYAEMYGHGGARTDYVSSKITGQEGADANSYIFMIDMTSVDGTISHEEIGVGPDEGVIKIRYITLVAREIS